MTKQAKQTLGFFLAVVIVVALLAMVVFSDKYGAWVWAIPAILVILLVALAIRYGAIRTLALGALDAIGHWSQASGSERIKERVSIPAEIRRQVRERAGDVCEVPDCGRRTRNHFHHIDENPSHNVRSNIVYICPNHHDDAHRGILTRAEQQRWARRRLPARSKA